MQSENKYQRGKIYKIISNQTNDVYYGSTVEPYLTNRLSKHRQSYKQWLNKKDKYTTSYEIVKFEDAKIILVETFPCNTKYELLAREQFYIDNSDCVNKLKAYCGVSKIEYHKQYKKKYHEENKEKILKYIKQYYKDNKQKIAQHTKQYNEENKEKISQYKKEYRDKNKLKINETFNCICGGKYLYGNKARHEISKKHHEFICTQSRDE